MKLGATLALLVASAAVAASSGVAAPAAAKKTAAAIKPYTVTQWKQLVAKAKQEGSVTLYSSQDPNNLATFAKNFEAKYGIKVTFNRQVDSTLAQQVAADESTHNLKADLWVIASKPLALGGLKNGWATNARGPDLFNKRYVRAKFAKPGKSFVVGAAVQGIAWNTQLFHGKITDYPDLLNAQLSGGKIGAIIPSGPSLVDVYLMLEEHYGKSYVTKLAAQKPKLYPSVFPMVQALAAGEVQATMMASANVLDMKAQGAPVDFVIPKGGAWNAPWYAMVLKDAPHPAAAQLVADYMVTPAGQASVNHRYGSVLKNVPDAFYVPLRNQKLLNLTPQKVTAYQHYWDSLFR